MESIIVKPSTTVAEVVDFFSSTYPNEKTISINTLKGNTAGPDRRLRALTEFDLTGGVEIELKKNFKESIACFEKKTGISISFSTKTSLPNIEYRSIKLKGSTTVQEVTNFFESCFPEEGSVKILTLKGNLAGPDRKLRALTETRISDELEITNQDNLSDSLITFTEQSGIKAVIVDGNQDGIFENEDEDHDNEFIDLDDEDDLGYPLLRRRALLNNDGSKDDGKEKLVNLYFKNWQCPTREYNLRLGVKAMVPDFIADIDAVCPKFSNQEIEFISSQISKEKIIPDLNYAPSDLLSFTKSLWWIVPFTIWKGDMASYIFIDKNGFYAPYREDNAGDLIFTWEKVSRLELDWTEKNLCRLTIFTDDPEILLTLDEFVPDGRGSYLKIINDIYEVYEPVIEASKGEPIWKHGAGGEGYLKFEKPSDLIKKEKWKGCYRP